MFFKFFSKSVNFFTKTPLLQPTWSSTADKLPYDEKSEKIKILWEKYKNFKKRIKMGQN